MKRRPSGTNTLETPPSPLSHNPFGSLGGLRDDLPAGAPPTPPPAATPPRGAPARAVVRYERKGRGGKEATIVAQLDLPPDARARWLQDLKQALGCGGALEGETLVLQGDQRSRAAAWLTQRGVRKVTVG